MILTTCHKPNSILETYKVKVESEVVIIKKLKENLDEHLPFPHLRKESKNKIILKMSILLHES